MAIYKNMIFFSGGRLYIEKITDNGSEPIDVTTIVAKTIVREIQRNGIRDYPPKDNGNAIILNGVRYDLVKPDVESCKECALDKFCDKFKDAICDVFVDGEKGYIFKKRE